MTFKQEAVKLMVDNGLSDEEAEQVFEAMKASRANRAMANTWDSETSGYPPMMMGLLRASVRHAALAWIDEHCPEAWFRPLFTRGA